MNREVTKTRSEQRIEQLINAGRPLTDEESDELYRALHADYMRKWRRAKAATEARHLAAMKSHEDLLRSKMDDMRLLTKVRREREQGFRQAFKADA